MYGSINHRKFFSIVKISVFILCSIVFGLLIWNFFHKYDIQKNNERILESYIEESQNGEAVFSDNQNGFSFLYSLRWKEEKCKEVDCLVSFSRAQGAIGPVFVSVRPLSPTFNSQKFTDQLIKSEENVTYLPDIVTLEGVIFSHVKQSMEDKVTHMFFSDTKRGKLLKFSVQVQSEQEQDLLSEIEKVVLSVKMFPERGAFEAKLFYINLDSKELCQAQTESEVLAIEKGDSNEEAVLKALLSRKNLSNQRFDNPLGLSSLRLKTLILKEKTADIFLEGLLVAGGQCDFIRISKQIEATLFQFDTVSTVHIFLNNSPLEKYFN